LPQTVVAPQTVVVPVTAVPPAAPAARTINVLAGNGQGTVAENAFLPNIIRVRVNDTVQWKVGSDEIHTVSFNPPPGLSAVAPIPGGGPTDFMIPPQIGFGTRAPNAPVEKISSGGYLNSGVLSKQPPAPGAPPNDTFAVTFDKAGAYMFVCQIHPYMDGVVVVEQANATTVPSQDQVNTDIKNQTADLDAQVKAAVEWGKTPYSADGPNKTKLWFVAAGGNVGDPSAGTYQFLPGNLTIKAGDTVVWSSPEFHTVTFSPDGKVPTFIVPKPPAGANQPPILSLNPQVLLPSKPSASYDPTKYYNSGPLGGGNPAGEAFALTFDKPGTYAYFCAVHADLGMKGVIVVQ
jgi:plastocyanin